MEISWNDHLRNKEVLHAVKKKGISYIQKKKKERTLIVIKSVKY
jgi:hypothetical protein